MPTEDQRRQALEALRAGKSQGEAARLVGTSQQNVSRWAKAEAVAQGRVFTPVPPASPPKVLPVSPVVLPVPQATIEVALTPGESDERLKLAHRRAVTLAPNTLEHWNRAVEAGEIKPRPKDVLDLLEIVEKIEPRLPDRSKASLARDGVSAVTILQKLRDAVERAVPKIQAARAQGVLGDDPPPPPAGGGPPS